MRAITLIDNDNEIASPVAMAIGRKNSRPSRPKTASLIRQLKERFIIVVGVDGLVNSIYTLK